MTADQVVRAPEEAVEAERQRKQARKNGEVVAGFKVHVPCLTWHRSYGDARAGRDPIQREEKREVRLERDGARVTRGGKGHVWVGQQMFDPHELLKAIGEVQGLEADNRDPDRVGFEWWVEGGSGRTAFKLRAGYDGEVALEQEGTYGPRREIYRIDDLLRALGLLGVLEKDGPQTLAPPAMKRPKPEVPVATEEELVERLVIPHGVLTAALVSTCIIGFLLGLVVG